MTLNFVLMIPFLIMYVVVIFFLVSYVYQLEEIIPVTDEY